MINFPPISAVCLVDPADVTFKKVLLFVDYKKIKLALVP